jgi:hypothetical protein
MQQKSSFTGLLLNLASTVPLYTQRASTERKTRLGTLLLRSNIIQRDELDAALRLSKSRKIQLGQALVELGIVKESLIVHALRIQGLLREDAIETKWAEIALHCEPCATL